MIRATDDVQIIYAERKLATRTFRHAEAIAVVKERYSVNIVQRLWACQCPYCLGAVLFLDGIENRTTTINERTLVPCCFDGRALGYSAVLVILLSWNRSWMIL